MGFIVALLGSMIVCQALYPGELARACGEIGRAARRRQDRLTSLIAGMNRRPPGRDYRWE